MERGRRYRYTAACARSKTLWSDRSYHPFDRVHEHVVVIAVVEHIAGFTHVQVRVRSYRVSASYRLRDRVGYRCHAACRRWRFRPFQQAPSTMRSLWWHSLTYLGHDRPDGSLAHSDVAAHLATGLGLFCVRHQRRNDEPAVQLVCFVKDRTGQNRERFPAPVAVVTLGNALHFGIEPHRCRPAVWAGYFVGLSYALQQRHAVRRVNVLVACFYNRHGHNVPSASKSVNL